jgi:hypothetical protein
MAYVARQEGEIHRWQAGVVAGIVVLSRESGEFNVSINLGHWSGRIKSSSPPCGGVGARAMVRRFDNRRPPV